MSGGERAFLEESHPKQVLVIAEPPAAALDMRLLHVNRVAELLVACRLVLHAQLHVFADMAADAMLPKGGPKTFGESHIAREQAIYLRKDYAITGFTREDMVHDKEKLLE